jgi:hypothetical protein
MKVGMLWIVVIVVLEINTKLLFYKTSVLHIIKKYSQLNSRCCNDNILESETAEQVDELLLGELLLVVVLVEVDVDTDNPDAIPPPRVLIRLLSPPNAKYPSKLTSSASPSF